LEVVELSQLRPTSIAASKQRGVVVVTIVGPVSASGGDLKLRAEISRALEAGDCRIVIDFACLTALDSSGLGELVRASNAVRDCGGRMAWANCPTTMHDLLEIVNVRFQDVEFAGSVDEAVALLAESGRPSG
jgi:anti-anti-sigma factor